MTAPIASGWSGCRMGFAPTGKRRLCTAHANNGHSNRLLDSRIVDWRRIVRSAFEGFFDRCGRPAGQPHIPAFRWQWRQSLDPFRSTCDVSKTLEVELQARAVGERIGDAGKRNAFVRLVSAGLAIQLQDVGTATVMKRNGSPLSFNEDRLPSSGSFHSTPQRPAAVQPIPAPGARLRCSSARR
jgi:hypothetical protein